MSVQPTDAVAHYHRRTGRKVQWDAAAGRFSDDDEANALITPRYRAPYRLPA